LSGDDGGVLSSGSTILAGAEDYEAIPEDEWIASDMTMYDSPLAELERQHCYSADASTLFPLHPSSTPSTSANPEKSHASSSSANSSA